MNKKVRFVTLIQGFTNRAFSYMRSQLADRYSFGDIPTRFLNRRQKY